ncbi:MAG: amidase [Desulfobacterales bacterium]|nr:amidase [Desulfobacterales bacterium]
MFSNPKSKIKTTLYGLGLREAARAIRNGNLSSEDFTRALLERIRVHEERVQAFQWIDSSRALDLACRADEKRRSGAPLGPLHGIGIGIKDIVETRDIPTTMGSAVYEGFVPERSATVLRRLEAAGAFVMGKTVTSEFAFFTPGKTRNPWNPAHTPGGSSSGSAAAVAMGFVPAAIGTQTNGSVIRPAAFCGVVGYKPTAGLIPLDGIHPFSPSLDQVGVFTRSVPDAAFLAAVLEKGEKSDPAVCSKNGEIAGDLAHVAGLPRFVAVRSPVWHLADQNTRDHFLALIERLRSAGATVEEQELPRVFECAHSVHRTIMYAEGARVFADLQRHQRQRLSQRLNGLIDEGLGIGQSALARALEQKDQLAENMDVFLRGFDAAITPPAPGQAPEDLTQTGDPAFCTIWSLCGVPAVTIPTGQGSQGLPLGLQLICPRLADDRVLSIAKWCDEAIGWPLRIAG